MLRLLMNGQEVIVLRKSESIKKESSDKLLKKVINLMTYRRRAIEWV